MGSPGRQGCHLLWSGAYERRLLLLLLLLGGAAAVQLSGTDGTPPAPAQPVVTDVTAFTIDTAWDRTEQGPWETVSAYELQYRPLFSSAGAAAASWRAAEYNASQLLGVQDPRLGNRVVQIVTVRADEVIQSGHFQLMFSLDELNELSSPERVVTRPIEWDASAQEMQQALEELTTIQHVQVSTAPP